MSTSHEILIVDVDGTLVRSDILFQQAATFFFRQPFRLPLLLIWALKGRAYLKDQLSKIIEIDPAHLPYRPAVLDLIHAEVKNGRRIFLISAAHQRVVTAISHHLGLFEKAIGSEKINLKGPNKIETIQQLSSGKPFSYVGDSWADLPIWSLSSTAYLINPSNRLVSAVRRSNKNFKIIWEGRTLFSSIVAAIRPHHWVKNLLVFIPIIAGHEFHRLEALLSSLAAFCSFSMASSAIYVANDAMDIESDQRHATKRKRVIASGELPIPYALVLVPLLLGAAVFFSTLSEGSFGRILAAYVVVSFIYSWQLKKMLILDTITLAALYTTRILVGGAAAEVDLTTWLLAFSVFLFFSLAMVKRQIELVRYAEQARIPGRDYYPSDRTVVGILGISSGVAAVIVLVLYLNSPDVIRLYNQPQRLWLITPLLIYWIGRIWVLADRGELQDDPMIFAIKDRVTWICGVCFLAILAFATQ